MADTDRTVENGRSAEELVYARWLDACTKIGFALLVLAGLAPFPLFSQDWPMLARVARTVAPE